jgi:hypothetical protein
VNAERGELLDEGDTDLALEDVLRTCQQVREKPGTLFPAAVDARKGVPVPPRQHVDGQQLVDVPVAAQRGFQMLVLTSPWFRP